MLGGMNTSEILRELCRIPEFNEFYHNEWVPIGIPLEVYINHSCPQYALFYIDNGKLFIELRPLQVGPNNAELIGFLVAHEMLHAIHYKKGMQLEFKMCNEIIKEINIDKRDIVDLAYRFGSMFDDPLVDSYLQNRYGFDPAEFYIKVKIPDTIKGIKSEKKRTSDDLIILKQALFYSQFELQFTYITNEKAIHRWNSLKNMYEKKRPKVKKLGDKIYSITIETGYDTLEKQRASFDKIADMCMIKGVRLKEIICYV
ncbi:MAG: hypothetical protein QHG98_03855 [Methanothrix sp.]|nr:hypothetical protein [Methanothrix sp.]